MELTLNDHLRDSYNALPTLGDAARSYQTRDAHDQVYGIIAQFFVDKGVHQIYGLTLIHQNFLLKHNERLVRYQDFSTPWTFQSRANLSAFKHKGHILPRSYRFVDGKAVAYEFKFVDAWSGHISDIGPFMKELDVFLQQLGLPDLFGVCLLNRYSSCWTLFQFTEGRTNILMPRSQIEKGSTELMWKFEEDSQYGCQCMEYSYRRAAG
ncbi:MAG: hypothetical protein Q9162_002332 [Coniocarpon cinnabarinum]